MVAKGSQVLAHSRPNRFVVERAGESLPEGDKPFHFGRSPGGLTRLGRRSQRFHSDLLPLPHLVEHEDDCEDDESGQKLEPPQLSSISCTKASTRPSGRETMAKSATARPSSRNRSLRPISRMGLLT